jgi:hypothetical protein
MRRADGRCDISGVRMVFAIRWSEQNVDISV